MRARPYHLPAVLQRVAAKPTDALRHLGWGSVSPSEKCLGPRVLVPWQSSRMEQVFQEGPTWGARASVSSFVKMGIMMMPASGVHGRRRQRVEGWYRV